MQLNNNSLSPLDINFVKNDLNIDSEFLDNDAVPFSILGKRFHGTTQFNGGDILAGGMNSIGVTGVRPVFPTMPLLRSEYTTHIEGCDELHVKCKDKHWVYSIFNFPYVDGIHRRIRTTHVILESHFLMEIVSAGKSLYWIVAPMEVSA